MSEIKKATILKEKFNLLKDQYSGDIDDIDVLATLSQKIIVPMLELDFDVGCSMWEYVLSHYYGKCCDVYYSYLTDDIVESSETDILAQVFRNNEIIKKYVFLLDPYEHHLHCEWFIRDLILMEEYDLADELLCLYSQNSNGENDPEENLYSALYQAINSCESKWKINSAGIDFLNRWIPKVQSKTKRAELEVALLSLIDLKRGVKRMRIIETRALTKKYTQGKSKVVAVDNVNLKVEEGEFLSIIGRSGSGKSTLLHLIGGIDTPDNGEILIRDTPITQMTDKALTTFRSKNIGFIFQNYNLINELNALENIRLPLDLLNISYDKEYENELLDLLELKERTKFYPYQLSGGQQQRVAIARALITKPAIILADEPTGNLDRQSGEQFFNFIRETNRLYNQTYLMVTHNMELAQRTDRILTIDDGKLTSDIAQL